MRVVIIVVCATGVILVVAACMAVKTVSLYELDQEQLMKKESNEVKYKLAELLLKKMQESGLISEEEREKITVLNMETFFPELAKVYL